MSNKTVDQELLRDIALHLPGGICVGFGAVAAATGHPVGTELSNIGIAYIGLLLTYQHITSERHHAKERRTNEAAAHAAVLRPEPGNVGTIVSAKFLLENHPERAEKIARILRDVPQLAMLDQTQQTELGYPKNATLFATNHSVVAIDGSAGNVPDLVIASARGATLQNENGQILPLVKIAAIRIALTLGQYQDHDQALETWNHVYHESRGRAAVTNAYRVAGEDLGGIVADGPIALLARKGTVVPYGDYRYLGFDAVEDVRTELQAENVAETIAKRGVYDADRQRYVRLHSAEIRNLATIVYERANERSRERDVAGVGFER